MKNIPTTAALTLCAFIGATDATNAAKVTNQPVQTDLSASSPTSPKATRKKGAVDAPSRAFTPLSPVLPDEPPSQSTGNSFQPQTSPSKRSATTANVGAPTPVLRSRNDGASSPKHGKQDSAGSLIQSELALEKKDAAQKRRYRQLENAMRKQKAEANKQIGETHTKKSNGTATIRLP